MSILLTNLSFRYGEKKILDGINLEVREREHMGILGSSGNGKSTLLKIIAGLYEEKEGLCQVAGETEPARIRKKVAVVMQTPGLFPLSIWDNITCGHKVPEEKVWEALRATQLEEWIRQLPEGLSSRIGERAGNLSGGQAQRIAIARALVKDAPVILLDEPTSALDQDTAQALIIALEHLTKGKTVIHVSHRKETLVSCNRILELKEGKLYDR